ncbi:MAG: hypothetical protein JNN15_02000 [Blastocatellia bacterium]|nr:hypothetical protein [Blastocatellia bacterium]
MNRLKKIVLTLFCTVLTATIVTEIGRAAYQAAQKTAPQPAPAVPTQSTAEQRDYSEPYDHFDEQKVNRKVIQSHKELTDTKNSCNSCHARAETKQKKVGLPLEYPYHDSCVKCHAQQFTDASLEICLACHEQGNYEKAKLFPVKASTVKYPTPVPPTRLRQFGMEFSHAYPVQHKNETCVTCHKPDDGEIKKSVRSTMPDHPECYECHKPNITKENVKKTPDNKLGPGGCIDCHMTAKSQEFLTRDTRRNGVSYDYFNFRHGDHLAHKSIGANRCDDCHNVNQNQGFGYDISRINIVLTKDPNKYHRSTCFNCHERTGGEWTITVRGGRVMTGTPDEKTCKRCHTNELTMDPVQFEAMLKRAGRK